jgi:5-methyltetrahydrofolate--homocysteine methyltransferase
VEQLSKAAFECAAKAAFESGVSPYIVYDTTTTGKLMEPMGDLTFDETYEIFKEHALIAKKYGADAILIETMADLYELKAAVLAFKENTDLPVIASITIEQSGRTYTGGCVESMALMMEEAGADAVGLNCSVGPKDLDPYAERLLSFTKLPVIIQPNAGLPQKHDGVTTFDVSPDEFTNVMAELAGKGVTILGGCCGTNFEYIKNLAVAVNGLTPINRTVAEKTYACTATSCLEINVETPAYRLVSPENADKISGLLAAENYDTVLDIALDELFETDASYVMIDATLLSGVTNRQVALLIKTMQTVIRQPFGITTHSNGDAKEMTRYYNGKAYVVIK